MNSRRLRISFNCSVRIFPFADSFEELEEIVGFLFSIPNTFLRKNLFSFTYIDDELDRVTVSNNFDLLQAFVFTEKMDLDILNMEMIFNGASNFGADCEYELDIENQNNPYFDILTTRTVEKNNFEDASFLQNYIKFQNSQKQYESKRGTETSDEIEEEKNEKIIEKEKERENLKLINIQASQKLIKDIFDRYEEKKSILRNNFINALNIFSEQWREKQILQRKLKMLLTDYLCKKPLATPSFSISDLRLSSPEINLEKLTLKTEKYNLEEYLSKYIDKKVKNFKEKILKKALKKAEKFIIDKHVIKIYKS